MTLFNSHHLILLQTQRTKSSAGMQLGRYAFACYTIRGIGARFKMIIGLQQQLIKRFRDFFLFLYDKNIGIMPNDKNPLLPLQASKNLIMSIRFIVINATQYSSLEKGTKAQIKLMYAGTMEKTERVVFIEISRPEGLYTGRMSFCKIIKSAVHYDTTTVYVSILCDFDFNRIWKSKFHLLILVYLWSHCSTYF